jgi:AcrR family transcriptional regulator
VVDTGREDPWHESWGEQRNTITDAVTIRDVARIAGYSTAIVSHYFTDKRDLLLQTYHLMASRAAGRLDRAVKRDPATRAVPVRPLPVDEETRTEWKVWLAFWGKAVADPGLAADQAPRFRRQFGDFTAIWAHQTGVTPGNDLRCPVVHPSRRPRHLTVCLTQ